jgi:threonine-phosphate decarboxylase
MTHGGDIYRYAKELSCNKDEIIDFSSNINLYRPDIEISVNPNDIALYPDTNYTELKTAIAKTYNLKTKNIALYNGATSAIYALFTSLKQKRVYIYAPLYSEYQKAALESKKDIYMINRINDIYEKPKKNSIVVFVNPATPDATYYNLDKLFKIWKKANCCVVLDESFIEFENLKSYRNKIDDFKKLYIVQSFSKFYSSAGIRIGAIFTKEKNIQNLKTQVWNISTLDASVLEKRLQDTEFKEKTLQLHTIQKKQLQNILHQSNLFDEIVPSSANFILCYSPNANNIFQHLLKHKILVRECQSFEYLNDKWLRFAVKDEKSQLKLQEVFKTIND